MMRFIRHFAGVLIGLALVLAAGTTALYWFTFRIYVPENKCAVLIRKMGDPLPEGQRVATEEGQKGIQENVLGPGRYFYNPLIWDYTIEDLTEIPAGDPKSWEWVNSLDERQRDELRAGHFAFRGDFPKIGVVTRKIGKQHTSSGNQVIVSRKSGYEGIWREVLTPGVYKLNPTVFNVEVHPAVVIPAGFVGVVTNLFDNVDTLATTEPVIITEELSASTAPADDPLTGYNTLSLAEPGERGTLRDVLQPGVYFINPKLQKVTLIEIGFNEYSQIRVSEQENYRISFPADSGFNIRVGVTVVWGIHPQHAAQIINEFGNIDGVLDNIISPQLRSICRNIGSTYAARDFIQGEQREAFQRELTAGLQDVCRGKNIELLLALVRDVEVLAPTRSASDPSPIREVTEDLKRTIQQSYIADENKLTYEKQREAATVKAELEEEKKKVDIAEETIRAETRVQVAEVEAEGEKTAAELRAQADLEVASIQEEVAKLDAQRIEILGKANADVERLKNQAEAEGYKLLVEAFGSPRAYNLYTFAKDFEPKSIKLFFAGEGTFWTDLNRLEEAGAAKLLSTPVKAK